MSLATPGDLPPDTITFGVRFQHVNLGDTAFQPQQKGAGWAGALRVTDMGPGPAW